MQLLAARTVVATSWRTWDDESKDVDADVLAALANPEASVAESLRGIQLRLLRSWSERSTAAALPPYVWAAYGAIDFDSSTSPTMRGVA